MQQKSLRAGFTVACWNANCIAKRLDVKNQANVKRVRAFIEEHNPDILFISEARMVGQEAAQGRLKTNGKNRKDSEKLQDEKLAITRAMQRGGAFEGYAARWTLDTSRNNGSGILWRKGVVEEPKLFYDIDTDSNLAKSTHHKQGR